MSIHKRFFLYYFIAYIIIFFPGEHVSSPGIFLYVISFLPGGKLGFYHVFTTLGILTTSIALLSDRYSKSKLLQLMVILFFSCSLIQQVIYMVGYNEFLNEEYFFITSLPFFILTIKNIKMIIFHSLNVSD